MKKTREMKPTPKSTGEKGDPREKGLGGEECALAANSSDMNASQALQVPQKEQPTSSSDLPNFDVATPDRDPNVLRVLSNGEPHSQIDARLALSPLMNTLAAVRTFGAAGGSTQNLDITSLAETLTSQLAEVRAGNLSKLEELLFAEAIALDAIFSEFSGRAARNIGQNLNAVETYMRFALKAQSQARASTEALAAMKKPRPIVVRAHQANLANGDQQIINNASAERISDEQTIGDRLDG